MQSIQIKTLQGAPTELSGEVVEGLQTQLRGALLRDGEAGYDEARTIWNAMIDRKPALIARCTGAADVMKSVVFARDNELLLAVRGGGHNIAGNAVHDDAFMIDLSLMNWVHVDAKAKRVNIGPGATLGDLDHETQAFALATPVGINSTTGIAGLTLGGGFGWLSRKYGLAIDSLVSADVVTAEGTVVRASADENADLFWGIRGGGGNFGVVTNFEFKLHSVGPQVLAGLMVFDADDAKTIMQKYREFVKDAPEELAVWVVLRQAPPLPFLSEEVHGKDILVLAMCYTGTEKEGQRLIEPLRGFGKMHGEHVGMMPFAAWQTAFDPLLTPGARNYWKSHNFSELSDGIIEVATGFARKVPSPQCEIFVGQLGGAVRQVSADATAYGIRDAEFVMNVHTRWEKPKEDDTCIAWAREFFDAATPHATGGVYLNFMPEDEGNRVEAAFGSNYKRALELKRKYDPTNIFRLNQNIDPS